MDTGQYKEGVAKSVQWLHSQCARSKDPGLCCTALLGGCDASGRVCHSTSGPCQKIERITWHRWSGNDEDPRIGSRVLQGSWTRSWEAQVTGPARWTQLRIAHHRSRSVMIQFLRAYGFNFSLSLTSKTESVCVQGWAGTGGTEGDELGPGGVLWLLAWCFYTSSSQDACRPSGREAHSLCDSETEPLIRLLSCHRSPRGAPCPDCPQKLPVVVLSLSWVWRLQSQTI